MLLEKKTGVGRRAREYKLTKITFFLYIFQV